MRESLDKDIEPRVTVLLPTHNRPEVLDYAIRSVLWQTEQSFELFIVGDGCASETRDVVHAFHDPRIRYFDLPKATFSGYANRNLALKEARGQYVAYGQDDDIFFPDHLAQLIHASEMEKADWSYSRPLWCTPSGLIIPFAVNLTHSDELEHFLTIENSIPSSCVMHTRSCLDRFGFWPEDIPRIADWTYWKRIISGEGTRIAYCSLPTGIHFRASWKTADVHAVHRMEAIANGAEWWPKAGKIAIAPGSSEQRIFFESIAAAGDTLVTEIRASALDILDRLAWSCIFPGAETWETPVARENGKLRTDLEGAQKIIATFQSQLDSLWKDRSHLKGQLRSRSALTRLLVSAIVTKALGRASSPRKL